MKINLKKSYIAAIAVALVIALYFVTGVLMIANTQYYDINAKNMEEAALILKNFTPAAVFTDSGAVEEWVNHLNNNGIKINYRITLIRRDGQVIFDNNADALTMENHLNRREIQDAVRKRIGATVRYSATMKQYYIYTAAAIFAPDGHFAGILRLSQTVHGFYQRFLSSSIAFLVIGLVIITGACFCLHYVFRRLSRSIEKELQTNLETKTRQLKAATLDAEAESRHREVILNSMFEGVITLDKNLNIILANPRICMLFGLEAGKDARGMSLPEFSHSAEMTEAAKQVISSGEPVELTVKRYISGKEQHFQVFGSPLEQGVVMVLGDISRLVKLENVRKDFAANVSHELRTPIQVIKGFSENLMESSFDNKDEIRHYANIISGNVQTMENIINDLLTIVSLENDNIHRQPASEFFLADIIAEAVNMAENAAKKKNIAIEIDCPPDLCANLHSSLFVQALFNLLDNGIKYSGNNTKIRVNAFCKKEELIIEVKDEGKGIPAEHINRIFERFYRVDRGRCKDAGGTGLGLAIVRHIALLHKGKVSVKSHTGEGSVFSISLPL